MTTPQQCPKCGAVLTPGPSGGNCLRCLLQLAFEQDAPPPSRSGDTQILEQPGDTITRYKLLQQIGEGGCGVVYMAEQQEPVRRYVAIKVIKLGMDTKSVIARFEAEQQAMALMDHPNIAKVLDAGATNSGRPFFVMELVRGSKITDYCDRQNLSTRERLALFVQVCNAIQHAHQKGVIHRDIKPSNILVTVEDGVPVPKVIDFGIAKATQQRLTDKTLFTAFEQFIGTPAYMSPEQAEMNASGIDTRSDIYSLGVLLYELLTSQTPFDATTMLQAGIDGIRRIIREQEPETPSARLGTLTRQDLTSAATHRRIDPPKLIHLVRGDLDWIVMKALEKDRTRRYETANGLAMDVQRHLSDEPVAARPPGNLYRFQKMVRRNKLAFAGITAVVAALAVGAVVSSWQALRATRAEKTANQQRELANRETLVARRAAAQSEARYLFQERLLPDALAKVTESFKLGGNWEDGLIIHNIASAAREHWKLTARVPLKEPMTMACMAATPDGPCLVETVFGGLRVLDASTGTTLGSAPLELPARYLFKGPRSNSVVVISDSAASVFSLPSLAVVASHAMPSSVFCATVTGKHLLLIQHDGGVFLLDLPTLKQLDFFDWKTNAPNKSDPLPPQAAISPDGGIVLFHIGGGDAPILVWDRRQNPSSFRATQESVFQTGFRFYDNTHFGTWFAVGGDSEMTSRIQLYEVGTNPVMIAVRPIPYEDIKYSLTFEAWSSKEWGWNSGFPIFGFLGQSGMVIKGEGSSPNDFTTSDRFANLLPDEADSPKFLAADLAAGALALRGRHDLFLFKYDRSAWNGTVRNASVTACRDGLLYVTYDTEAALHLLTFVPFNPHQTGAQFQLENPSGHVVAMAATPDASTVAVVAQTDERDDASGPHRGRVRALIYHPESLNTRTSVLPVSNTVEFDAPHLHLSSSPRFLALAPDGHTLLYWNAAVTTAMRYDSRDGKPLGTLELGRVAARSRDGRRVAAISSTGRLLVYDLASGKTLLELANQPASAMCFSTDGSLLVVSQVNNLTKIDIASGRVMASIRSQLLPLAYPTRGNRFLAFQPDTLGTGGSLVLADTEDAQVMDVLNRAGSAFTPAFFSDSGDQIALARNPFHAEVVRSLAPADLVALLNSDLAEPGQKPPSPSTNRFPSTAKPPPLITVSPTATNNPATLRADDIPVLLSHLGSQVTVEGRVQEVTFTAAANAMHLEFASADERRLLVWIAPRLYPKLMQMLNHDPVGVLKDQTVRVTGPLDHYDGRHAAWKEFPQITLDDPSKLMLVAKGDMALATVPAPVAPQQVPPSSDADTNIISAENIPLLISRVGNEVIVEGRVHAVTFTAAGNAMNVELAGGGDQAPIIWVSPAPYPKLKELLGANPERTLRDQTVRVTGQLGYYNGRRGSWKGRLEIALRDPSKFLINPSAPGTNGAAASTPSEKTGKH